MRRSPSIRLAFLAAASTALGTSLDAQTASGIDESGPFRCVASSGYFNDREAGSNGLWTVASGSLVFHEAHPDCQCGRAEVSLLFTDASVDPDKEHGNGLSAVIGAEDPTHVHLLLTVDGKQQAFGEYAYGTPIPFKVIFDDAKGSMTVLSGKFAATKKLAQLRRSTVYIPCMSADVSVAGFALK